MDKGTKIRTVVSMLAFILLCVETLVGKDLSNFFTTEVLTAIATLIVVGASWIASHWFNNDYTKEACESTGEMRLKKMAKKAKIIGENFFDTVEDIKEIKKEGDQDA